MHLQRANIFSNANLLYHLIHQGSYKVKLYLQD
jgi:hypothetical protein